MRPYDELLQILPGLRRIKVEERLCRAVRADLIADPGAQVIFPQGSTKHGQRFTAKGGALSIYLAYDLLTALGEVGALVVGDEKMPRTIATEPWVVAPVDVVLDDVLDLLDPAIQASIGTTEVELQAPWRHVPGLKKDALPPTQPLGQAAYACNAISAMRYASAKISGGACLVVFYDRLLARRTCKLEVLAHGRLRQRLP